MTLVTVSEAALQAIRGRSTPNYPSTHNTLRSNSKHTVSFQRQVFITLFLLGLMLLGGVSLFGVPTLDQDLQELRLEFKRDVDSLRTEVEHHLVPQLLATAEMQHKKTLHVETIVDDPSHPTLHKANPTLANAVSASWEYVHATFLHYGHAIFDVFVGCKTCAQQAIHHELNAIDEPFSLMAWIPDPGLVYTFEYIKQKRIEFCVAYAFVFWFLYKIFRHNPTSDESDGKANNKKSSGSSKSPSKRNAHDDCSENAAHDDDDVMNDMFHDAMATAGWPVVASPAYNRSSNRTNATNRSPAANTINRSPAAATTNGTRMSKEERRRRARENAMKFAARDKQRLERRGAPTASSPVRKVSSPAPAPSARVSKTSMGRKPSHTEMFSPRASKKDRLKQARANAKLFAQHDKERIRKAIEKRNRDY